MPVKEEIEVAKHVLVPSHRILKPEELQKVLDHYKIKPIRLPRIFDTDPAIKDLNAKPGDVIEIKRNSLTSGGAIYYRIVVGENA